MEYPPTPARIKVLKDAGIFPWSNDLQVFAKLVGFSLATTFCFFYFDLNLAKFFKKEKHELFFMVEGFKEIVVALVIFLGIYASVVLFFALAQKGFVLIHTKTNTPISSRHMIGDNILVIALSLFKGLLVAGLMIIALLFIIVPASTDYYKIVATDLTQLKIPEHIVSEFITVGRNYLAAFCYIWGYVLIIVGVIAVISRYCIKKYFKYCYRMTKSEIEAEAKEGELPDEIKVAIKIRQAEYQEAE